MDRPVHPGILCIIISMANGMGEVIEIRREPGGTAGVLALPSAVCPAPGQYLLASLIHIPGLLPEPLFPSGFPGREMRFAPPLPPGWLPGARLALHGPLGKGFALPNPAPQVALAALGETAAALLPLALLALQRGAAVVLYSATLPADLPAEVELLPLDLLPEAATWADYLALDLPVNRITDLSRALGLRPGQGFPRSAEALVRAPMPCAALAECGVCAVHTRSGWKLGCKDGPVFPLNDLILS